MKLNLDVNGFQCTFLKSEFYCKVLKEENSEFNYWWMIPFFFKPLEDLPINRELSVVIFAGTLNPLVGIIGAFDDGVRVKYRNFKLKRIKKLIAQ